MIQKIFNFIKKLFGRNKKEQKFILLEDSNDAACHIRIEGGKYDGVVFSFSKVEFREPPEEDKNLPLTLRFEYDIMEHPQHLKLHDDDKCLSEFETVLGDYLIELLTEEILEPTRTHNPAFAADERDIYEEDSTVS